MTPKPFHGLWDFVLLRKTITKASCNKKKGQEQVSNLTPNPPGEAGVQVRILLEEKIFFASNAIIVEHCVLELHDYKRAPDHGRFI